MEIVQKYQDDSQFDTWTSSYSNVEIAEDHKRAIITIPLMRVGANKKHLYWSPEMLKKIAPMFRGVAFRYDLDGQEGSSHTTNKLSSPHFDVGWTYKDSTGAWYDSTDGILWVKGEVTTPEVVDNYFHFNSTAAGRMYEMHILPLHQMATGMISVKDAVKWIITESVTLEQKFGDRPIRVEEGIWELLK